MSVLEKLFDDCNCDKGTKGYGSKGHQYWRVYEKFFEPVRHEPINLLEIGVWKAKSFNAYVNYFTQAEIYGIDLFERIPLTAPKYKHLLENPKVHLMEKDSTVDDPLWGSDVKFDLIIDDGDHSPGAQLKTFRAHWDKLKVGGTYFIEDVLPMHKLNESERNKLSLLKLNQKTDYDEFYEEMKKHKASGWDLRPYSGKKDSFIFQITKT